MRIDELLNELDEIVKTASSVPLTGKVMVEAAEIKEIIDEIDRVLPDEIKQARWIQNERDRILTEAKNEYATVVNDAKRHADSLVAKNEILARARKQADEVMMVTEENVRRLKMSTYDYVDSVLYRFDEQMAELEKMYQEMFETIDNTFSKVKNMILNNRDEIKEMAYRTQMNKENPRNEEHEKK